MTQRPALPSRTDRLIYRRGVYIARTPAQHSVRMRRTNAHRVVYRKVYIVPINRESNSKKARAATRTEGGVAFSIQLKPKGGEG